MKAPLLASPGSTVASDPARSRQESANSAADSEWDGIPLESKASGLARLLVPRLGLALLLATGAACGLLAWQGLGLQRQPRAPKKEVIKIWDPDLRSVYATEPLAKSAVRKFDAYNVARGGRDDGPTFDANVELYLTPDFVYESVGFGTWKTPAGWAVGEEHQYGMTFPETVFTQMLFFGDDNVSTTTTYGRALWSGDFFGIKAPMVWLTLRITDVYHFRDGRAFYNFMMIDWADAFRQIGRRMLPAPELKEGLVLPPSANDGVPAPISLLVQAEKRDAAAAYRVAHAALLQDWSSQSTAAEHWHEDLNYYGPAGIGLAPNASAYKQHVLQPFKEAFAGCRVAVQLSTCEGNYCVFFGRIHAQGKQDWLGLPTTGRDVSLRFVNHYRVIGDKVQEGWTILDYPGLFQQLGMDFYKIAAAGGRL